MNVERKVSEEIDLLERRSMRIFLDEYPIIGSPSQEVQERREKLLQRIDYLQNLRLALKNLY